jgi:transcriptional regulator with XRE-family HTH domain
MNQNLTTFSGALGAFVRSKRTELNLEQSDLANALGLSQASYSRIEAGKANISVDHMCQIAKALNISYGAFMTSYANYVERLEENGVEVIPAQRGNSKGAEDQQKGNGKMILGAALGALAVAILSNR